MIYYTYFTYWATSYKWPNMTLHRTFYISGTLVSLAKVECFKWVVPDNMQLRYEVTLLLITCELYMKLYDY